MRLTSLLLTAVLLSACVPAARPPMAVATRPEPARSALASGPQAADWRDWPLTPGTWRYADRRANFASITLSCDADRRVRLSLPGAPAGLAVTVRTSSVTRAVQPAAAADRAVLVFDPGDPLLDAMAFSRGRFALEQDGRPPLVVPAWAETGRVVQDCRQ